MTVQREAREEKRIIGEIGPVDSECVFVCVGGLHGNEPAGVRAIESLFEKLDPLRDQLSSRIIGLRGNIGALEANLRYLDTDLNRSWKEPQDSPESCREEQEKAAIQAIILPLLAEKKKVFLADLHTTSSESTPFLWDQCVKKILPEDTPVPILRDDVERLTGTMACYFSSLGVPVICAEGGSHYSPASARHLEDIVWLGLRAAGALPELEIIEEAEGRLRAVTEEVPGLLHIFHHHMISPEDRFQMEPGFKNFDPLKKGTLIAHDQNGEIRAPQDCFLLLPLYQPQGDDGFLLASAEERRS
ncbi:succinylglutamate desuccinylase/aspartoacylase family protein [bacterium]|nr:succinylglutamate desuccinylase/aspartoacylase family protein [bacterium]